MDTQATPLVDEPVQNPIKTQQKTEEINHKHIPVGTLDDFAMAVFGKKLDKDDQGKLKYRNGVTLGIEKFQTAGDKFYRLIWIGRGRAWLAAENVTCFRRKIMAMAAGEELATTTGAYFDEGTR